MKTNIKLNINILNFSLPEHPLAQYIPKIQKATNEARNLEKNAGTNSKKYEEEFQRIKLSILQKRKLEDVLKTPIDLRAFAFLLNSELSTKIELTTKILDKIEKIQPKPSSLLVEAILSYYFKHYDEIDEIDDVEWFLSKTKESRGELSVEFSHLLGGNGPKWLAEESHRQGKDFDEQVKAIGLDRYISGRFLMVAKNIYYLDVLRGLKPNQSHPILYEIQKQEVYDSRYDEHSLVGHQVLRILIEKVPESGVSDTWLNIVLVIAGDPRTSPHHPKFQKWWLQIDSRLRMKVQGWLSKHDLRLFLEALEDFSNLPGNEDLKRMYPARKHFMEGLLKKQLVTGTRLFLSDAAQRYLKRNYKQEHLPNYSHVDGNSSLIHIQLGSVQIIEGSHNCKLWVYKKLSDKDDIFNYSKKYFSYQSLTNGLNDKMTKLGLPAIAIVHNPHNFSWQHKALMALQSIGVQIDPKIVLLPEDYLVYKRLHGV